MVKIDGQENRMTNLMAGMHGAPHGAPYGALIDKTRSVLRVAGADAASFLQGLISNDVIRAQSGSPIYAALLTPQGKYLFDFFVVSSNGSFLIDVDATQKAALAQKFSFYRLRARVEITDESSTMAVACVLGLLPQSRPDIIVFADPRDARLGTRLIGPHDAIHGSLAPLAAMPRDEFERLRIRLHVPASADFESDKMFLLDMNFDELSGVDFRKGCFVGQEVTARMKHRASARKRFLAVSGPGTSPAIGTPILAGDHAIGELRSSIAGDNSFIAIAQFRLDRLKQACDANEPLTSAQTRIEVSTDDWWRSLVDVR